LEVEIPGIVGVITMTVVTLLDKYIVYSVGNGIAPRDIVKRDNLGIFILLGPEKLNQCEQNDKAQKYFSYHGYWRRSEN